MSARLAPVPEPTVDPQNLEAEESVLGAMMLSPAACDVCSDLLAPSDFYRESHGLVYRAALRLHGKGEPVDVITLTAALEESGELEQVGGRVRLHELAALVPATANVGHYARIVLDKALRRELFRASAAIAQLAHSGEEVQQVLGLAEQNVYEIGRSRQTSRDIDLGPAVRSVYEQISSGPKDLLGVPTGLVDVDRVTRGFRPGDLVVVAADTGRGKSALALNAAMHLLERNMPVAFFSLEMSEAEILQRALSLKAGIPHDRLTRGELREGEQKSLLNACGWLARAPLKLRTDATIRPSTIASELRRWKARAPGAALAIVDYLQLITPDEKTDNRTVDVSGISRALKVAAMSTKIPIIAISQFHRRVNPDERPHRSNLRESGAIENDASVVLLVHRPTKWDTDPQRRGTAEVIVAKNRHGAEDVITLKWWPDQMRFGNHIGDARAA